MSEILKRCPVCRRQQPITENAAGNVPTFKTHLRYFQRKLIGRCPGSGTAYQEPAETPLMRVRQWNSEEFIKDFRRVRSFVVWCSDSQCYVSVLKREVWQAAQRGEIFYQLTDKVYVVKRTSMEIL